MQISLTGIQVIDLFFRFAAVGQLLLVIALLIRNRNKAPISQVSLIACIIGYVLLTAPIANHHYGALRHILLLLTDLTPFITLWFAANQLETDFKLAQVNKLITIPISIWCLILAYVFLVLGGQSILHDLNHVLGIALLAVVIYWCVAEYVDDLDNKRRSTRLLLVAFCSFYMLTLVSFEFLYKDIRDSWQFSLANAFIMFALVCGISACLPFNRKKQEPAVTPEFTDKNESEQSELKSLRQLMEQGGYLQPELTIGKLAQQMSLPEHKLRQLINQELGFSNFSHYLNSYRIPWVCQQLQDKNNKNIPVLTLALEAGYGSIAPFNRAFKKQMALTPKQYRDQF